MSRRVRTRAEIEVWGTIIFIDVASEKVLLDQLNIGIEKIREFVLEVDEVFSTYKNESVISKLRRSELYIQECPSDVVEVWNFCAVAREITDGSFDPWCVTGGFDPSGYVKGWAADRCIKILKEHGGENIQINAAGDLSLAGGFEKNRPWSIGIQHPDRADQIAKVFELADGAIATSGTYEKGSHIKDPHTGLIAIGARSATVCGPDGGLADALATALIVSGKDGAVWFGKPELAQYSAWVIDRHSDNTWSVNADSFVQ